LTEGDRTSVGRKNEKRTKSGPDTPWGCLIEKRGGFGEIEKTARKNTREKQLVKKTLGRNRTDMRGGIKKTLLRRHEKSDKN